RRSPHRSVGADLPTARAGVPARAATGSLEMAVLSYDPGMEVFLIPVDRDRYELYCEVPDLDDDGPDVEPPRGFIRRLTRRFLTALADVERERHGPPPVPDEGAPPLSRYERIRRKVMCRLAESIAEQR